MNKLIITGALAAVSIVGIAAPAFAQSYDPQHDSLHDDLDAAHQQLHAQGVEDGPAHEQWHERADRLHTLEHMNEDAVRQQQYYNTQGAYGRGYTPGYYGGGYTPGYGVQIYGGGPSVYFRPGWGHRRFHRGW